MNGENFRGTVRKYMEIRGVSQLDRVRNYTNLSRPTFSKYWKDPEQFTIYQFEAICRGLKIPNDQKLEMLEVKV